jgi:type I restriction enzyme R subunit
LYRADGSLRTPYQDHLNALLHEPSFRTLVGPIVFAKAKMVKDLGNLAVHSHKQIAAENAVTAARELFHVLFWVARRYARRSTPSDGLRFDAALLPAAAGTPSAQSLDQLRALAATLRERDGKLAALDEEIARLRAEIVQAKRANDARPDTHDYSEADTRKSFLDVMLKEAGWALADARDREFEVEGMPNQQEKGYVDYVLWGDDGLPLAVVEAKKTSVSPGRGQQQAKLYADCLERRFGRRPVIFYSNGYEHWLWDDATYPPREVQGFYTKDQLELLIQRRTTRRRLADAPINQAIVERGYQQRAIRRIGEAFENDHDRKALIVMATGAGKTRTVIALIDLLMRCNWVKRVLFLADRNALVGQAVREIKKHLPGTPPVNLVTEKDKDGRVLVSTYPTMMGLIDESRDGQRRFGVGHFDLIVIDEAHRSVYQKYRAIFDYFDALLVGLTATPRDEIDRNTYGLFDLETGVPTDAYELADAIKDGHLVPAKAMSVPLKFQREGIRYAQLSEDEKDEWDAIEWSDDGTAPARVEPEAVNRWLFNQDTVDKVLEHLMTNGQKVAGGDRLGKTIIFAKNHEHAAFIVERFDTHYPKLKGEFARVVDFQVPYVATLIEAFGKRDKPPYIAVSVDMLDTGIDVPEVVNLVFFKLVRSKTKFWQMLGRGTRLCPDLFGPGDDKRFFTVFDYCQNLEFFGENPETIEGGGTPSLGTRLFRARVDLIGALDHGAEPVGTAQLQETARHGLPTTPRELREDTAELLRAEVAAMNVDNFVVRPKRRLVETYAKPEAWLRLTPEAAADINRDLAGLPSGLPSEEEEAKRFDLLLLNLQLAVLRVEPGFALLRDRLKAIAERLAEKSNIPMVQPHMALILELQTEEWWQDVTAPMLEGVRRRLRGLIKLIDKRQRQVVYTDFEDEMGSATVIELAGFTTSDGFARFREKARQFLRAHADHLSIRKLRTNAQLTPADLAELERMLAEAGIGTPDDVARAKQESQGLGLFVRSLVGLDREAAKEALGTFMRGKTLRANQIEFLDLIVDHLTENGTLEAERLYESPYTDLNALGVEGVFASAEVAELMAVLDEIRRRAA